ncbi:unnamed protein product [Lupinus luteus]|uniref:WRKY domain-containing protein n=1 Tax=Lupinus luteus TaxID=3873 RepID=A0AAV1W2F5_LUPLU
MAHEDWDLFAIVRSCKAATFTTTPNTQTPLTTTTNISRYPPPKDTTTTTFIDNQENGPFCFPNIVQTPLTNGFQEQLNPLFMTFNPTTNTSGNSINPNSFISDFSGSIGQKQHLLTTTVLAPTTTYTPIGAPTSGLERFHQLHQQQQHGQQPQHPEELQQQQEQKQHNQVHVQRSQTTSMVLPNIQTPKSRKRKSQQKKIVCRVTADNLSSDLWAWRKYGQKPIKGSPYPRNYYRCSSCKGCAARKQVERSTTEPNMFILTYTGEHKHPKPAHRSSLAGSTRNKSSTTHLPETKENGSPSCMDVVSPTEPITTSLLANMDGEEPKPESGSDDEDVLIPNSMGNSEAVFLGSNSVPGLVEMERFISSSCPVLHIEKNDAFTKSGKLM